MKFKDLYEVVDCWNIVLNAEGNIIWEEPEYETEVPENIKDKTVVGINTYNEDYIMVTVE